MRLLDLFCGAGGAAMGYHRAGFTEIVGVDIKPQPGRTTYRYRNNGNYKGRSLIRAAKSIGEAREAMGIDWMTWEEIREAIPPAYTEFIGRQLLQAIT